MTSWVFLTNHARVLLCIPRDPGAWLRDIATRLVITERSAHGIVADLAEAGYVVKQKDGRRNRYQTLRSLSVCSPRPNRAGRAVAIIRLACGALTGKLIAPAPATVSRTFLAGTDSCALNAPGACEPSRTLASRSLGVIGIPVPAASRVRSVSQATGGGWHSSERPGATPAAAAAA